MPRKDMIKTANTLRWAGFKTGYSFHIPGSFALLFFGNYSKVRTLKQEDPQEAYDVFKGLRP